MLERGISPLRFIHSDGVVHCTKKTYALRYVLEDYSLFHRDTVADEEDADDVTTRILSKHVMGVEQLVT